jgi:hypothetical protein
MRKYLVGGVLSGALLVLLSSASASASPSKDIVNGTIGWTDQTVTMSSQTLSGSTSDAKGSWTTSSPDFSYSGTVDTLLVDGQIATACGTITSSTDPTAVGDEFQQYVDNTGNGSPHGSGDTSQTFFYPAGTSCVSPDTYQAGGAGLVNTSGNWHVFDADAP